MPLGVSSVPKYANNCVHVSVFLSGVLSTYDRRKNRLAGISGKHTISGRQGSQGTQVEQAERIEQVEWVEWVEWVEQADRVDQADQADQADQVERADRADQVAITKSSQIRSCGFKQISYLFQFCQGSCPYFTSEPHFISTNSSECPHRIQKIAQQNMVLQLCRLMGEALDACRGPVILAMF